MDLERGDEGFRELGMYGLGGSMLILVSDGLFRLRTAERPSPLREEERLFGVVNVEVESLERD